MADTRSNGSKSKTQAKRATTEAKKSAAQTAKADKRAATKTAVGREEPGPDRGRDRRRLPGRRRPHASATASPSWSSPGPTAASAEKQIKSYRTQLRRTLKRTERRGTSARRKATTEARKTRNRVEREARKRQRTVETTLKRNRNEVEPASASAIEEQTSRAQGLVEQVATRRLRSAASARAARRRSASTGASSLAPLVTLTGDGHRPRGAWLIGPALAACCVGAELEADAAAVVVAEAVGVAEAAAGVGLRRCGTRVQPPPRKRNCSSTGRPPAASAAPRARPRR